MKNTFALFLCFLFFSAVRGQSCFDKARFADVSRSGPSVNSQGQTLEQFNASFLGCQIPKFKTSLTDGTAITEDSLYGKVVVIYFWSMHDNLYTNEVPYLNRLVDTFAAKKVLFLAICRDDPAKWDKRSERFFHFKHIAESKPVIDKFKAHPVMIIFDKNGKTAFFDNGLTQYDKVLKERFNNYMRVIKEKL